MDNLLTDSEYAAFLLKWTAALRSGAYRQAANHLRTYVPDDALPHCCCLGVACDLRPDLFEWVRPGKIDGDEKIPLLMAEGEMSRPSVRLPRHFASNILGWYGNAADLGDLGPCTDIAALLHEVLPHTVLLGLPTPLLSRVSLSQLNDAGATFAQIADIIERAPFIGGRKNPLPDSIRNPKKCSTN